MAKSRNRLFAEILSSTPWTDGSASESTVETFEKIVVGEGNTEIDSITANTVAAVTYNVVADKSGSYNYTTIAAVKNSSGSIDYTEYATIESGGNSLCEYSVELVSGNIILYADPTTTGVEFKSTRTVVEE
jgi:hypothetical protein